MRYITGIYALNLNCSLGTPGDWHQSALNWKNLPFSDSANSVFGDYGIELNYNVPEHIGAYYAANHIRALLDLIDNGKFSTAQGMRDDYIGENKYNREIFEKVLLLKKNSNWLAVNEFMGKEYKLAWLMFLHQKSLLAEKTECCLMDDGWKIAHEKVIKDFLLSLNQDTDTFILKGGTALAQCYASPRFSEDIDLDSERSDIIPQVSKFCEKRRYKFRVAKDTKAVKRCFVNYGNDSKPLKIKVSYRNPHISKDSMVNINNIRVYRIDRMAKMKATAYVSRDRLRDLQDLTFVVNNYFDLLSKDTVEQIRDALMYKGIEQFDYLIATQQDDYIDKDFYLNLCNQGENC